MVHRISMPRKTCVRLSIIRKFFSAVLCTLSCAITFIKHFINLLLLHLLVTNCQSVIFHKTVRMIFVKNFIKDLFAVCTRKRTMRQSASTEPCSGRGQADSGSGAQIIRMEVRCSGPAPCKCRAADVRFPVQLVIAVRDRKERCSPKMGFSFSNVQHSIDKPAITHFTQSNPRSPAEFLPVNGDCLGFSQIALFQRFPPTFS